VMSCPSCNSSAVLYDELRGEQICTRCGLVLLEKMLEPGPDWRVEPSERTGRADITTGVDITRHDWGLGSKFGLSDDLPPSWRARLRRLQLWQRRSRAVGHREKSLREALIELDKLCEDLRLPKGIRAEVSGLYRKTRAKRLTIGRGTQNVLAALTFITCRLRGAPRTDLEVAQALASRAALGEHVALRSLRQLVKFLTKRLGLQVPRPLPEDYIDRFVSQLNLSRSIVARAHSVCNALPPHLKRTKSARLLAAAAIYTAARGVGVNIAMRELASSTSVGITGLSQTIKRIREILTDRGE
jgi:transcription initiation factor TFIIB